MKIFIKTLKDTHFEIEVNPEDTVGDVKKHIETVQGPNKYGAVHQMLIHQGKVLQNHTTLRDNKVAENHFLVIMLTKTKGSRGEGSSVSAAPTAKVPTSDCLVAPSLVPDPVSPAPESLPTPAPTPEAALPPAPITAPASALPPTLALPPIPAPTTASVTVPETCSHDQATSNLVAATNFNQTVQDILDMGGGFWDRDTVVRALQAAYNNPETAVEYLCSGLPERADVPPVARAPASGQPANAASHTPAQSSPVPSSRPYTNPLDHLPQGFPIANSGSGGAGVLEFLRHSPQIQALGAIVQANPQMLQPMLQELGKQNPLVVRLIQEHEADFLRLINEPIEGGESNIHQQLNAGTPQAIQVTPAEREAIERLEAMGFYRATVLEVYFACNKNEELAANYLLDHMHDFED